VHTLYATQSGLAVAEQVNVNRDEESTQTGVCTANSDVGSHIMMMSYIVFVQYARMSIWPTNIHHGEQKFWCVFCRYVSVHTWFHWSLMCSTLELTWSGSGSNNWIGSTCNDADVHTISPGWTIVVGEGWLGSNWS